MQSNKISEVFSMELDKMILKCISIYKGPRKAKIIWKRPIWEGLQHQILSCYKATVIKNNKVPNWAPHIFTHNLWFVTYMALRSSGDRVVFLMNDGYVDGYCVIILWSVYICITEHLLKAWILSNYNLHTLFFIMCQAHSTTCFTWVNSVLILGSRDSSSPLTHGGTFQHPQWMTERTDSTEP